MIILDTQDEPANRVNLSMIRDLEAGLDLLEKATPPPLVVIRSGKTSGFACGPDLLEWARLHASGSYTNWQQEGMRTLKRLANLPCPTIAAVHGPCLGPGFELALACDFLLTYARPDTVFCFPEAELGAFPAWGMSQRILEKSGLEAAARLLVFGEKWKPARMKQFGLVDSLAQGEQQLRSEFARLTGMALRDGKQKSRLRKSKTWRRSLFEGNPVSRYLLLRTLERFLKRTTSEELSSQLLSLQLLASLTKTQDPNQTEVILARHCSRLFESDQCKYLVQFSQADLDHIPQPQLTTSLPQRVGLIGAGKGMSEWAFLHISRSLPATVVASDHSTLGATLLGVEMLMREMVRKGIWTPVEVQNRLGQLEGTDKLPLLPAIDLAYLFPQASRENSLQTLGENNPDRLTIASAPTACATDALLFQQLPLGRYPCAELAFPSTTPVEKRDRIRSWLGRLGRQCVETEGTKESLATRVFFQGFLECLDLVSRHRPLLNMEKGLRAWGFTASPLYWADWVGIKNLQDLSQRFEAPAQACHLLEQMIQRGWTGIDVGKGWFLHRKNAWVPNNLACNLTRQHFGVVPDPVWNSMSKSNRLKEGRERVVFRMLLEISRLRHEGMLSSEEDWNYLAVRGMGWPAFTGGPGPWVRKRGKDYWISLAQILTHRLGDTYQLPSHWDQWF